MNNNSPFQKVALEDFQDAAKDDQLHILYLGNEGMLFGYRGFFFAFDPYLSYYTDQNCCTPLVKWVRRYAPPYEGKDLAFISALMLSHGHYDHSDPYTLESLLSASYQGKILFPAAEGPRRKEYHLDVPNTILAHADHSIQIGPLKVTPIPAAHEELHQDKNGAYFELGYLAEIGPFRIFHAGDMCPYPGLQERLGELDVACMPINGRSAYKKNTLDIIGNFTIPETVSIAKAAHARLLIPMHYDLYDVNQADPKEFIHEAKTKAPEVRIALPRPGESMVIEPKK